MKPVGLNNIHARTTENLQLLVPVCALADTIAYALITVISLNISYNYNNYVRMTTIIII